MFLVDDLLLAPFRGIKFIAESVHDAAQEHIENERQALRDEINDLYMQLEIGEITEEEFERREKEILDRLDELAETETELREGSGSAEDPEAAGDEPPSQDEESQDEEDA